MKARFVIVVFFLLIVFSSCVSKRKLMYLQYSEEVDKLGIAVGKAEPAITPPDYKLMPYDNLYIRVITPDPQWSAIFNPSSGGSSAGITQESAALSGYPVDNYGFIEIPYVGKLAVAGKTLSHLKVELDSIFKKYVSDASISVRLVNNYVSIIGEVRVPGRYMLTKDRLNIFEALSLAGDMTEYSNRRNVKLIRESPYGPIVRELSLDDRSIFTSDYYYVMPNDIIYAPPMQGRAFQTNATVYTLFLTTITTVLVILSFFSLAGN
jgi:polysaccharide biosynthesis/export protein